MTLGNKIKYYRNNLSMTQKQLANKASISLRALSNYEKDVRTPPLEVLMKIAKALCISINDLDRTIEVPSNLEHILSENLSDNPIGVVSVLSDIDREVLGLAIAIQNLDKNKRELVKELVRLL